MKKNLWCTVSDGNHYWFQIFRNATSPKQWYLQIDMLDVCRSLESTLGNLASNYGLVDCSLSRVLWISALVSVFIELVINEKESCYWLLMIVTVQGFTNTYFYFQFQHFQYLILNLLCWYQMFEIYFKIYIILVE